MNAHSHVRKNILVVDDDVSILDLMARLLRDRYDVRTAADGCAAVHLAREIRPDLVILDYRFPGVDGLTILRELRDFDPGVRVMMLTGDMDMEVVRRAFLGGALGYLTKPLSPDDIREMVDGALAPEIPHARL